MRSGLIARVRPTIEEAQEPSMRRSDIHCLIGLLAALLPLLSGCAPQRPMTTEEALAPAPGQAISVPPGARLLAAGHYPLASFVLPRDGGMIYVYDADTGRVVFVNSYAPDSAPAAGDLTQLSKNSLDPTHNYRVYYLPSQSTTPATRPSSGAGQYWAELAGI